MTEYTRRAVARAAGASLFGVTAAGCLSVDGGDNAAVPLLECGLTFEFGDAPGLEAFHIARPTKYAVDPENATLTVLTVTDDERRALLDGDRLVHFRGIEADVTSIGDVTVDTLHREGHGRHGSHVATVDGYEMPAIDLQWDSGELDGLLSSDVIGDRRVEDGFLVARLPSQEVEVRRKVVREDTVDADVPPDKRGAVVERSTDTVSVEPSLTVGFHPGLDVVT